MYYFVVRESVDVPFTQGYAWRFKSKITVTTKSSDDVKLLSQLNRKLLNTFTLAVVCKMKVTAAVLIIIYTRFRMKATMN